MFFERLGEFMNNWESFGGLGKILEHLGEFWRVSESFGVSGRVLESFEVF